MSHSALPIVIEKQNNMLKLLQGDLVVGSQKLALFYSQPMQLFFRDNAVKLKRYAFISNILSMEFPEVNTSSGETKYFVQKIA